MRIPERMAGMPSTVCKSPVQRPASAPASTAQSSASRGFMPPMMHTAATAPPAVIYREVGVIQDLVGDGHADGHDAPDKPLCQGAGQGIEQRERIHGLTSSIVRICGTGEDYLSSSGMVMPSSAAFCSLTTRVSWLTSKKKMGVVAGSVPLTRILKACSPAARPSS